VNSLSSGTSAETDVVVEIKEIEKALDVFSQVSISADAIAKEFQRLGIAVRAARTRN
jgi:hypothetical protein